MEEEMKTAMPSPSGQMVIQASAAENSEGDPVTVALAVQRPSTAEEWDRAVANSRDTWLNHRSDVVAVFTQSGCIPPLFVECRLNGALVGGAILSTKAAPWHGLLNRKSMHGTAGPSWTSPFVVSGFDSTMTETIFEKVVAGCLSAAKKNCCEELVLSDSNQSLRCVEDRPWVNRYVTSTQWKYFVSYFWRLDLRQEAGPLWRNVATSQRTQIKNARAKLQVVRGTDLPGGREALVELVGHVQRREGLDLVDTGELSGFWDAVYAAESGQTFFCLADGKPCAVAGIARFGKVASYVHAGRSDDAMNGAAALCLWSGIEWAKSAGCEWFDLNSMIPERDRRQIRAVSQFKKRFGGEIITAQGARIELGHLKKATCAFIDAWGAAAKGRFRTLPGKDKACPTARDVSDDQVSTLAEDLLEPSAEPKWDVVRRSPGPTSAEEWDAAVKDSRETWLYHLSRLAPLFLPPGADPLTFLELRLDGNLCGGAILGIMRYRWHGIHDQKYLLGQIGPQTVSPFLVRGLRAKPVEAAWDRLLNACMAAARDMGCLELTLWDTVQSPRVIEDREIVNRYSTMSGWSPLLTQHYVLDLSQDVEALFKNVQSRRRTYIRRAREQLQVVTSREFPAGRDAHIALMEAVYEREGRIVVPRDQLLQIYDAVYNGEDGEAIFCLQNGEPITFTGVSRFGNVASYLHGGRTDETQHGAHALGFWSGVEWAKAAGCRWFDCNAATFEKEGRARMRKISEFKRGFGGFLLHVHGAKQRFHPLARANYEFIDAWGVQAKQLFRNANPFRR
jgi:lipid II:glycine glycyltransferase (peptidoglycan interpeptide bridge formation enzyme)